MPALDISKDLVDWFNARWVENMGAIDGQDVAFVAAQIATHQPRTVAEIGCASGLSTSVLAGLMSGQGGGTLDSFDLLDRYYVDHTKRVGYLLDDAPAHPGVTVTVNPGKTCLDVGQHIHTPIDLCFIDAGHKHPWPLIDTLAVLPLMRPGGIIIHHDLQMFRSTRGDRYANGPKMVLDQAPGASRILPDAANQEHGRAVMKSRKTVNNIFALRVPNNHRPYGARLSEGFYLGWDKGAHTLLPPGFSDRFAAFLAAHYGPAVGQAWAEGLRRYAGPQDVTGPANPQPQSLARGLAR